jgi:PAS domain-containing protein
MANAISRAVIEVLLDRVSQGAATLSPEAQLSYVNQRLATLLGRTRAQLVGKPLADLAVEADRAALTEAIGAGRDTTVQCRVALQRANGSGALPVLLTFAPLGHGQASCLVTDLSQSKPSGVAAPDVRELLGGIRNTVEALKRSGLEGDAQRTLESLEHQTTRVLELLSAKE